MSKIPEILQRLADDLGGKIDSVGAAPDGSGFATMSMPLPKDHWLTAEGWNKPPMPFRLGTDEYIVIARFPNAGFPDRHNRYTREEFASQLRAAARYACRASTMNGKEIDFDPDAMVQNFVTGMLGYWTPNGLSTLDGDDEKAE